jgi:hypothetical protein
MDIDILVESYLNEKIGFQKYPEGWNHESVVKFAKTLVDQGATQHGFFDKCVKKMSPHLDDPEGFCASVIDEVKGTTFWRGKGKGKKD